MKILNISFIKHLISAFTVPTVIDNAANEK